MAKVVQYKPDPSRKLGFRKVGKDRRGPDGQLDLFAQKGELEERKLIRYIDPFEKGLSVDGRNDEVAEKLYLEAIEQGISVADAYCNLGIIYARKGLTTKAINHFTNALKEDPRHTEGHYNLANMYYDAGNYSLAEMHYQLALEMDGGFSEIYFNLALTLVCLDHKTAAIKNLQRYLEIAEDEQKPQAVHLLNMLELSSE